MAQRSANLGRARSAHESESSFRATQSGLYVEHQLETLAERGYGRDRALDVLGLTVVDLDNPRLRVSLDQTLELYLDAERQLDCPTIALEVGHAFRVSSFGKSGRIYAFCRDLEEVIEVNGKYQKLAIDAADISLVRDGERAYLEFATYYSDAEHYRHITDLVFGAYGTAFRWLNWGSGKGNKAVFMRHRAVGNPAVYEAAFGCPVTFGASHDRLELYADTLDMPLPTADPQRLALTCERLDRLMEASARSSDSLEAACRAAIQTCIRQQSLSLANVAEVMERTERQLRSDLKGVDLTYRKLVDDVRQELFNLRRGRGETYATIAQALGYNDQAAFNRAYKRWYGKAPGAHESNRGAA